MDFFIQHYVFVFLVILVLFVYLMMDKKMRRVDGHIFRGMVALAMALVIVDLVFELLVGSEGVFVRILLHTLLIFGYFLTIGLMLLGYFFVDFYLHHDTARLRRIYRVLAVPFIMNIVFALISIFTGFYYRFDSMNNYLRGPGYWIFFLIGLLYLVLTGYQIVNHRRRIRKTAYYSLFGFIMLILVASIIQSLMVGLLIFVPTIALALLMVFIFFQSEKQYLDHVTEVFNLEELGHYLSEHNQRKYEDASFAAMVVQFDAYQHVLTEHSYADADKAMTLLAKGLKDVLHPLDFIARMDADRFVVLMYVKPHRHLKHIKTDYDTVMKTIIRTANISFSFDYRVVSGLYNKRKHGKIEALIADLTLTLQGQDVPKNRA